MRRKAHNPVNKLKDRLWKLLKIVVISLYGKDCYTCTAKNLIGANCQLGHMWAKASLSNHLKWDIRVLRIQCFRCNIHFGGNGAVFYARMLKEIGKSKMEKLEKEKQILVKADEIFFTKKIKELESFAIKNKISF